MLEMAKADFTGIYGFEEINNDPFLIETDFICLSRWRYLQGNSGVNKFCSSSQMIDHFN